MSQLQKIPAEVAGLIRMQKNDGSFQYDDGVDSVTATALALVCLNNSKDRDSAEVIKARKSAADFLLAKKNKYWSFSENIGSNCLALSALFGYDPEIISGSVLARVLMMLTSAEVKEGGPYYSYADKRDNEIDIGVNAAVAYFLFLQEVELPELVQLVESAIERGDVASKLFSFRAPVLYIILKWYKGNKKELLVGLLKNEKANKDNQLEQLLFELIARDAAADEHLVKNILDEGEAKMMEMIMAAAQKRFSSLNEEIRNFAMSAMQKTIKGNRDKQMPLMAYYMKKALGRRGENIADTLVAEMGLANIFFWTAFIIYDDFWDEDEAASPRLLPTANLFARHYVDFFSSLLPKETEFRVLFHKLMDKLDEANTWETMHCRTAVNGSQFVIPDQLPDYGDYSYKYRPASGHIAGSIALLVSLGFAIDSIEIKHLISYFKHYLIAMQLNDDAHDWEEDMARGHLSTVVVLLLNDLRASGWKKSTVDLVSDLPELKKIFWVSTMKKYAEIVRVHAHASRQALDSLAAIEDRAPLLQFITNAEHVAIQADKERKKSEEFITSYEL